MRGSSQQAVILSVAFFCFSQSAFCDEVSRIPILKISGQDQRAVIKTTEGTKRIIKPGDQLGKESTVVEVATGRVVIEEKKGTSKETVIIRFDDGKQRVERMSNIAEPQPVVQAAQSPEPSNSRQSGSENDPNRESSILH